MRGYTAIRQPIAILTIYISCLLSALSATADPVQSYTSKYYAVTSDLSATEVRGILLRLDYLVPEFNQNFPALRGAITHKFDIHLYRSPEAFHAAGAPGNVSDSFYHPALHRVFIIVGKDFEHAMHELQFDCF